MKLKLIMALLLTFLSGSLMAQEVTDSNSKVTKILGVIGTGCIATGIARVVWGSYVASGKAKQIV